MTETKNEIIVRDLKRGNMNTIIIVIIFANLTIFLASSGIFYIIMDDIDIFLTFSATMCKICSRSQYSYHSKWWLFWFFYVLPNSLIFLSIYLQCNKKISINVSMKNGGKQLGVITAKTAWKYLHNNQEGKKST